MVRNIARRSLTRSLPLPVLTVSKHNVRKSASSRRKFLHLHRPHTGVCRFCGSRDAERVDPSRSEMLLGFPFPMTLVILNPRSNFRRALLGSELAHDEEHIYSRNLEIPAGGGVGTARAIARAYSVFANGGKELGLCEETLHELKAPAVRATHGFYDECMRGEAQFSLGFMKPSRGFPFGTPNSFGFPGAGGSFGFADPDAQIGYGYIPNRKGVTMGGDPRDVALRRALYSALPVAQS